ncbi:endonuclease [Clostridiaceae bacterium M8S5]|nr:endonuclease [Clostridiaceae bacterium M8S5]
MYNNIRYRLYFIVLTVTFLVTTVFATTPTICYSVFDAININNHDITVNGYIVGEPVLTNKINTSNFKNDYAIAIADSRNESDTNNMIFVKLDKDYRNNFGLKSNPHNKGMAVRITGTKETYFNHSGIKNVTSIVFVSSIAKPDNENKPSSSYNDYYADASGKTGLSLKATLNDIIDNHKELSYSDVWQALRDTDEDPNNSSNVILLYTGKSTSKYNNGGDVDNWNREHVWAKSHGDFGTRMGAGTDLHHIRPADVSVNSSRGNKNFDKSLYRHHEATDCFHDSDSFEPRDEVKGDVARMIFYMATRYEGKHGEVDLEVVNYINNSKTPYHGILSTLLKWHKDDPVSEFERVRNDKIYKYQGNRNPFIDHPEWVEAIWN